MAGDNRVIYLSEVDRENQRISLLLSVNPCPNERSQGEQKRFWSRMIHILKDRNCLLFAEKDLCDGQFIGLYEYVDFVAFGEELSRREKILLA